MDAALDRCVAEGMETDPALLPYLGRLLEGVDVLGTPPAWVTEILRAGGLAQGARVLDLGCGKGAVTLEVAASFGARVVGVDGLADFIDAARAKAAELGLADRCRFEVGDLREWPADPDAFDAVLFTGIGDLLWGYEETIARLRRHVRPGGLVVFEDSYRVDGGRDEIVRALTSHGDELLAERALADDELEQLNAETNARIAANAARLERDHPESGPAIRAYARRQQDESDALEEHMTCGLWLLERRG